MTEHEWLTSTHPPKICSFLLGKTSERKLRLLACACCRQLWHLLSSPCSRAAVALAEEVADNPASSFLLHDAASQAQGAIPDSWPAAQVAAAHAVAIAASPNLYVGALGCLLGDARRALEEAGRDQDDTLPPRGRRARRRTVRVGLCNLLRDVVGNPFGGAAVISPGLLAWENGTPIRLAEAIYQERRFEDLPILADALEDAGSTDDALLDHLRRPGPHARGCWALDLLLAKSETTAPS